MPLRSVLEGRIESLQEMYLAEEQRFREAVLLLESGKYDAGIYLLGYCAEMLLKLSYCRLDRAVLMTDPVMARLAVAERRWRTIFQSRLDLHDLTALLIVLEDGRVQFRLPALQPHETNLVNSYVFQVYENWWVSMRYRDNYATNREAEQVKEGVEWLRNNHTLLWR